MLSALTSHIQTLNEKVGVFGEEINKLKLKDTICDCSEEIEDLRKQVNENKKDLKELKEKIQNLFKNYFFKPTSEHSTEKETTVSVISSPQVIATKSNER